MPKAISALHRSRRLELLDTPGEFTSDLPANLADIRLLNRWFGGTSLAVSAVHGLAGSAGNLSLLDVATGSADIPLALMEWAHRIDISLDMTAADISAEVLAEAGRVTVGSGVRLYMADARSLPWPEGEFDVVLCCLALHHFSPEDATTILREMWRVCRHGIVVTDLTRGYLAYAGAWLVTRTLARNRITRHDGPLSVLRAYTPVEMRELAREAGIEEARVRRHPLFRQSLTALKADPLHAS